MLLPSIRRLSLSDLTDEGLRDLIAHGESLYVDRKRRPPDPPRFGAAVAAFANTLGGWILLGVDDDGGIVGYDKPPQLDLQSHLANLLRAQVDPLPPFVAEMREIDDRQVAVVRVFESTDAPHIVRGTGAVYLRTSKGKEPVPVDDHRTLLELARRGEHAEFEAGTRVHNLPAIQATLMIRGGAPAPVDGHVRWVAWAAPVTVTAAFSAWPLSRRASEWCKKYVSTLLPSQNAPYGSSGPWTEPFGRGIAARVERRVRIHALDHATVVVDSGGLVGLELRRGSPDPSLTILSSALDSEIRPLAKGLADGLAEAEAFGRAVVGLWLVLPPAGEIHEQQREGRPGLFHVARELTVPADHDEVEGLAQQWFRELRRSVGVEAFEDDTSERTR